MDRKRKGALERGFINFPSCHAISRRKFLGLGLAAGAAGIVGMRGNSAAEQRPAGGTGSSPARTPKRGGVLKLAVPSAARRLDPAIHGASDEFIISQAIFNNLVRVDEKLNPQPELATKWKISEDGKIWTFNLRKGVKFHHGRQFTSKDVEFTIKRILDPATASIGRSLFQMIDNIEVPDPFVIRFHLKFPYSDFAMMFGAVYARILPFDRTAEISKNPIGTGPFKMKEFVPADYVRMIRNPEYWEKDEAGNPLPYVDELRQVTIPEQAAQIAALTGGAVHILWEATSQSVPTLKADSNVKLLEVASPSYHEITIWVDRPPFQDVRVRQALKYTLDRDQIVKAATGGYGTPSNDNPISPISPFWIDTGMRKRDIEKAKSLLTDAGYQKGLDLELITSPDRPGLVEYAVAVKEMSAPAGFRINVKSVAWDVYTAKYNRKHPFNMQNWNGRPTIDESLYPYFHSKGSYKELYHFSNKDIDRLLDEGRMEGNFQKRKEIYGKIQKILIDYGPNVIAYHRPYIMAIHKSVKGYKIHPIRWSDVRKTWLS
jgi:peptide/nickel transport system substrate-binding protein